MQKEFSHYLRQAYINALRDLTFNGVAIPVSSEFANFTPATVPFGTRSFSAYVTVKNQTENDDSVKDTFNSNASLQLHIVVKYPAGRGSELQAELIADDILKILFPSPGKTTLSMPGFSIWRAWKEGGRVITTELKDSRIFTKILILNHSVQQLQPETVVPGDNTGFDLFFDLPLS